MMTYSDAHELNGASTRELTRVLKSADRIPLTIWLLPSRVQEQLILSTRDIGLEIRPDVEITLHVRWTEPHGKADAHLVRGVRQRAMQQPVVVQ